MSADPPPLPSLTLCDLTQSYSEKGGGIRTYISEKRSYIDRETPHRHLLIIPGPEDRITEQGRHITAEIKSPHVPGSPNYRLLLRNKAVRKVLADYLPASIECLDAYNLPWAAIRHKREVGNVSLIAGYRTDFPTTYVQRLLSPYLGGWIAGKLRARAYRYAGKLYSRFDKVYTLNQGMADRLTGLGVPAVDVLPLGVDLDTFSPTRRDDALRAQYGVGPDEPLLIYAGRIDDEKRPDILFNAFKRLPDDVPATLVLLGEGNYVADLQEKSAGLRIHFPGFLTDRTDLARHLASADIYVSAMPFETFGISIIEAQAAGLPVVGVAAGAMPDRVPANLGRLGPIADAEAMADNITALWSSGAHQAMGQAARQHVEANFSWRRTFERLFAEIYSEMPA